MLKVGKSMKIDEVVILGDYADFYAINSHGKHPAKQQTLMDEVIIVIERLQQLRRSFPKAKIVFIEGNHEHRLARYIQNRCPDMYGVTSTDKILELSRFRIKFIPYGPGQQYPVLESDLKARHEPLAGGKHVAQNTAEKAMCSVIFGHTHRLQEAQTVSLDGKNYRGISSGWLGDSASPVFDYVKSHYQWAQGFSITRVFPDGSFHNRLVHIIDYKCIVNGKLFKG